MNHPLSGVFPMITIRIGRRGQITLPSQLRKKIGLQEGNQVAVISQGDLIILRPITHTLLELRGSVPVEGKQPFEDIRHQVIQSHAGEVAQIDG
jgi:AbrB family looped-hinge helix DNA binding protein